MQSAQPLLFPTYVRNGVIRTTLIGETRQGRILVVVYTMRARMRIVTAFSGKAQYPAHVQEQAMNVRKPSRRTKPERKDEDGRILFDGPEDIPTCKNEEKELQFWRTHAPSDDFVTRMRPGDPFATPKKVKTLPRR